eukprot:CCRYP_009618-RA/>CCRYP_009618-RA protein AED:0.54 eAED:0.46 QI:0/-1/0/1/-1/1/1/0/181
MKNTNVSKIGKKHILITEATTTPRYTRGWQFCKSLLDRTKGKIVACCRSPSNANELQRILSKYPERVQVLPLGMEDQSTIDALEIKIAQTCRRVDALFNVAGILGDGGMATPGPEGSVVSIDRDWLKKSLAVNIIGPVMLTKALSPLMRVSRRRSITLGNGDRGRISESFKVDLPKIVHRL